jgi:hypothetical protein
MGEWLRRWIILISADWVPHYISSSRGCLALGTEIIPKDARLKRSRIPLIGPTHRVASLVYCLRLNCWVIVLL